MPHFLSDLYRLDIAVAPDYGVHLAGQQGWDEVEAHVYGRYLRGGEPGRLDEGRIDGAIARDAGYPDFPALHLREARDVVLWRHDQRVQGHRDDRGDSGDRQAFLLAEEHFALVGNSQVDLVQADELDRVSCVGGRPQRHVQVILGEVALVLRVVNADVVGVRYPVNLDCQVACSRPAGTTAPR